MNRAFWWPKDSRGWRWTIIFAVIVVAIQNFWYAPTAEPLVFGWLPMWFFIQSIIILIWLAAIYVYATTDFMRNERSDV